MDRVTFFESISNDCDIEYPDILVKFFDQLIALKQLVENTGSVVVYDCSDTYINFSIKFGSAEDARYALAKINSLGGTIVIYNRPITIGVEVLTDKELKISLV